MTNLIAISLSQLFSSVTWGFIVFEQQPISIYMEDLSLNLIVQFVRF
jgi:hypothetical protein